MYAIRSYYAVFNGSESNFDSSASAFASRVPSAERTDVNTIGGNPSGAGTPGIPQTVPMMPAVSPTQIQTDFV